WHVRQVNDGEEHRAEPDTKEILHDESWVGAAEHQFIKLRKLFIVEHRVGVNGQNTFEVSVSDIAKIKRQKTCADVEDTFPRPLVLNHIDHPLRDVSPAGSLNRGGDQPDGEEQRCNERETNVRRAEEARRIAKRYPSMK